MRSSFQNAMPEHPEHSQNTNKPARTFLDRLASFISSEPDTRTELLDILHDAHERKLIDSECLSMIEGVFRLFDSAVRDVMIPRSQMYVIDITRPVSEWIGEVMENGHSRYPAIEGDAEKIVGIVHAKDLLHYREEGFSVREILHPAVFIPESKRLNVLLRDFRNTHNHMAIVVDEFGNISGLVTIEDVLEQIVGDIEDEFDDDEDDKIVALKAGATGPRWRIPALTEMDDFNRTLGTKLADSRVDTIGGYVANHLGRVPHKGDAFDIDGLHFEVVRADARQLHTLVVEKKPAIAEKNPAKL